MSDFFRPIVMANQVENPVIAAVQRIMIQAQLAMPWVGNLSAQSSAIFYGHAPAFPALNPNPAGLTAEQGQQWEMIWQAMQPITKAVLAGEMKTAQAAGEKLAANSAFWASFARVTAAVATLGISELAPAVAEKWAELKDAMKEWRTNRDVAQRIAADPRCPPDKAKKLLAKLAELDGSISSKVASAIAQYPAFSEPVKSEGLGVIAALAALPTAVTLAVIAGVLAMVVYAITSLRGLIKDLGLEAIGQSVGSAAKLLGPVLGIAALGLVGLVLYKKFGPKSAS